MSSLKDIMDVDVEPLESQAYRRSREAALQPAHHPPPSRLDPPPNTSPLSARHRPSDLDEPIKRRKSDRPRPSTVKSSTSSSTSSRSHAIEDDMAFPGGFSVALSSAGSASGSSRRLNRNLEQVADIPVKYTPVTGRISRAKKGVPVHTCDQCPGKVFTRAEHLRRHKLSHEKPSFPCTFQDCERAFFRPDLLTRHMQRHETQGEKPYKANRSRNSSVASDGQSPFLPGGTRQGSAGPSQNSPRTSLTPQALPTEDHSMMSPVYGQNMRTFSATGYAATENPPPHKRARSVTLPEPESYNALSPGATPMRSGSGNYDVPTSGAFTDPSQPRFNGVFTAPPNPEFHSFPNTPQLHLLQIPEEPMIPGLSYTHETSPWCSSASSNCSGQSEGPRGRFWAKAHDRASSSSAIPDWPIPVGVPQWTTAISTTPQDMAVPAFESVLDSYDSAYTTSPRAVSNTRSMLSVPTSSGFYQVEAAVGTPALSTYKSFAQNPSASSSQFIDPGLDADRSGKPLVGSSLLGEVSMMNTVLTYPSPTQGLESFVESYFQHFDRFFPIIHKPTFNREQDSLLTLAIAAIGSQYHSSLESRTRGAELNETVRKGIDLRLNWSTQTMQAILLTEMFTRFRGRKTNIRLSRHFDEIYSRLLNGKSADQAKSLAHGDLQTRWFEWIDHEARQRLLATCFMFDIHQSMYHERSRSRARRENASSNGLNLPCPEALWIATAAPEWSSLFTTYTTQMLQDIEHDITPQGVLDQSPFSQTLLICSFAARLPKRVDSTYPNDFIPSTPPAPIQNLVTLFPASPLAHIYLALHHTPLHDLLAISGDTWVFAEKITPPSAFHAAQSRLRTWSSSLAAAQATYHACRILSAALSSGFGVPGAYPTSFDELKTGALCICDYWSLYVAALICWAFGNRYQIPNNSSRASATLTPSLVTASSTTGGLLDTDSSASSSASTPTPTLNEARQKALIYVDGMLGLSVEDLLTSKASFKGDTSGVIEAVKQRLEMEGVGNRSALIVDAIAVLGKIGVGGRGKWF